MLGRYDRLQGSLRFPVKQSYSYFRENRKQPEPLRNNRAGRKSEIELVADGIHAGCSAVINACTFGPWDARGVDHIVHGAKPKWALRDLCSG